MFDEVSYESLDTGLCTAIQCANFLRVNSYVVDQVMHKVRVNSYSARKGFFFFFFFYKIHISPDTGVNDGVWWLVKQYFKKRFMLDFKFVHKMLT